MGTQTLYRPVGLVEAELILRGGRFPRRRPEQPIFYPVLEREYARMIARRWNARGESQAGFVTQFQVDAVFLSRYPERVVGGRICRELWVPAQEVEEFNSQIVGSIHFVDAYYGESYRGSIPGCTALAGLDAHEQLDMIVVLAEEDSGELERAVIECSVAVQLNFAFWVRVASRVQRRALITVLRFWKEKRPTERLLGEDELMGANQ